MILKVFFVNDLGLMVIWIVFLIRLRFFNFVLGRFVVKIFRVMNGNLEVDEFIFMLIFKVVLFGILMLVYLKLFLFLNFFVIKVFKIVLFLRVLVILGIIVVLR